MISEVTMPSMGADMSEGTIVKWLKKEGDEVKRGDKLAEIETDKTVVEMECYNDGILKKIIVQEGQAVPVGDLIAYIGDDLIDIPVMEKVGIPIAVANAIMNVKEISTYITKTSGGYGAFREAVSWIIGQQGRMDEVLETMKEHILKS